MSSGLKGFARLLSTRKSSRINFEWNFEPAMQAEAEHGAEAGNGAEDDAAGPVPQAGKAEDGLDAHDSPFSAPETLYGSASEKALHDAHGAMVNGDR